MEADEALEIVGIVADAKAVDYLADFEPVVYLAYPQHYYPPGNALLLSTTIEPRAPVPLLEQELRAVNPRLALVNSQGPRGGSRDIPESGMTAASRSSGAGRGPSSSHIT